MNAYEEKVYQEAVRWKVSMTKRSSMIQRSSKRIQSKINAKIPGKVHKVVTEAIRKMMETALFTSEYIRPIQVDDAWSFRKREEVVEEKFKEYKRTAVLEGAGTGAGGILLGAADFPLLLSIKMKFLFDISRIYGFDVTTKEERMYVLHVFMLAFSSDDKRVEALEKVLHWDESAPEESIDWKELQLEYRDTIDFVKMLQLLPGIGAAVGAFANARLMEQLSETAKNSYRLRLLDDHRS
ncbi:EcsC family protein [Thalassobacillus hwangdonensis]|uniref:EcsC family protein n=1 Tax=Thalassobacillus hwangdonensis TaxID=546108 RepID=A0ABW3KXF3_9BACI